MSLTSNYFGLSVFVVAAVGIVLVVSIAAAVVQTVAVAECAFCVFFCFVFCMFLNHKNTHQSIQTKYVMVLTVPYEFP